MRLSRNSMHCGLPAFLRLLAITKLPRKVNDEETT